MESHDTELERGLRHALLTAAEPVQGLGVRQDAIRRTVTRRRRTRWAVRFSLAGVAAAAAVAIGFFVSSGGNDDGLRTVDRRPSTSTPATTARERDEPSDRSATSASAPARDSSTTSTSSTTTEPPPAESPPVVAGRPGGPAPCAPASSDGEEGASVGHPERAPLIAEASFSEGVRWAICGASPVFSDAILNLRSDDDGATWSVNDTGLGLTRSHAGDRVDVTFTDATSAEMHLVSLVAERDEVHRTTDGGRIWR